MHAYIYLEYFYSFGFSSPPMSQTERRSLHFAAEGGHLDVVELLVVNGVEREPKDKVVRSTITTSPIKD